MRLVLANEFVKKGHRVEFVLMRLEGELLAEAQESFPVVGIDAVRARNVLFALASYLRRARPDALIAAMWPLTVLAPLAGLLSLRRCRVLVSEHAVISCQYATWGWWHRWALRLSTALCYRVTHARVAVSVGVAQDMARLSLMAPDKFEVVNNPAYPNRVPSVDQVNFAESYWLGPPGARIITVGRFKAVKNYSLLLRSFARGVRQRDAQLMFVGGGPEEAALRGLALSLGVADRVIFAGFHLDPTPFYLTADLFVLSSNQEGFGNVIVEALSSGLPVVSTDCPTGPGEILEKGRYGTLVPVGDAQSLGAAMEAALVSAHDVELLRRRARDFDPEIAASRYLELLARI